MKFELMELPYEADALAPFIGAQTVKIHHGKHHGGYVTKLDAALKDDARRDEFLDDIVLSSAKSAGDAKIFNLAAQIWNHNFYWMSLSPSESAQPSGEFADHIKSSFGGMSEMTDKFSETAANAFGSGWAWLSFVPEDKRGAGGSALEITSTSDAANPMTEGRVPLLTLDVWEHAYYLDYQNERPRYIKEFLNGHANWEFAAKNFGAATAVAAS